MTGRNPFVFVVGCPRSGTTLLQRMLDAHPQLAVANDTHFITRAVEAVTPGWRARPELLTTELDRLVAWSRGSHRFRRLGLGPEAVDRAAAGAADFAGFVRLLYDELASLRGKPLAGDKTPGYVHHLALLHAFFPWAKVVHLLRDGRDVALSALEWATPTKGPGRIPLWSEDPLAVCALWWRSRIESGRRDARLFGEAGYLEVRYEELVESPARELTRIVRFLGLPFAEEMLAFNRGKVRPGSGRSAKSAWLGPTPGLRDWRRQMDPASVALFEVLAGETLEAAGYPRRRAAPPSALRARARRAEEQWAGWTRAAAGGAAPAEDIT